MQQPPDFPPQTPGSFDRPPVRSGLAVAALVLGIAGILLPICFPAVIGLVFGIVALNQIGKSEGHLTGGGMAVAGIVLGTLGIVVSVVAILSAIMFPALGQARRHANFAMNASQQRGIVTSLISYSETNTGRYPGIGRPDEDNDRYTDTANGEGCDVEARYHELLFRNYFTGELAINPFEVKTVWTQGPVTTDNYSYAMLHIGEDDQPLAKRAVEWKNTINSQAANLSDRNITRTTAKADVQSLMTSLPGEWEGSVGFNDNHIETLWAPVVQTKYGTTRISDFNHNEFFDTGDYLFDAGETDDAGRPVGDRETGSGAYMVYEGTGL